MLRCSAEQRGAGARPAEVTVTKADMVAEVRRIHADYTPDNA